MANNKTTALVNYTTPDGVNDVIPIVDFGNLQTKKITRNNYLGITGAPVGTTDTQNLTNKTLNNTNTVTLKDNLLTLQDDGDTTKQAQFQLSGITTGTTRTYTLPNASDTLVNLGTAQTLTSKTLTSPVINTPTITNATLTADSISGFSVANTGTIYGVSVAAGIIASAALVGSVNTAALATGIQIAQKESNLYKFSAYRTAAYTTVNAVITKFPFDSEQFDTGSNFDSAINYRFTAPVAGFYWFSGHVDFGVTSTRGLVILEKNGAEEKRGTDTLVAASEIGSSVSCIVQLAVNDYVELFYYSTPALAVVNLTVAGNYFQGFLISAT